jgi:hypothetical protein
MGWDWRRLQGALTPGPRFNGVSNCPYSNMRDKTRGLVQSNADSFGTVFLLTGPSATLGNLALES